MTGTKDFLKLLEMIVNEEERTRIFKEYLEEKTSCTVRLDRLGIPGITENFEIHNIKLASEKSDFRINAELIRLTSTQLATLFTAGKILLNADTDIPVEKLDIYGLYVSVGNEDDPSFEMFIREAFFEGIEFKIRYDQASNEPLFTGTVSTREVPTDISIRYQGMEIPDLKGDVSLTLNLKTLTGKIEVRTTGSGLEPKGNEKKKKEKKKEKISLRSVTVSFSADFTLLPYMV